jgi:uncharacterized protein (TIGR02996 family)
MAKSRAKERKPSRRDFLTSVAILCSLPLVRESVSIGQVHAWALPAADWIERITADPDNETLRRAYADWLTEHDNPLGEYIRLECDLDHVDRSTPAFYRLESKRARLAYEGTDWKESLLAKWSAEGFQEMDGAAPEAKFHAGMRRGMLEELSITNLPAFISHHADILREAPLIRALKVEEAKDAQEIVALVECPALVRVRELEFSECELDESALQALAASNSLGALTCLRLVQCTVDGGGLAKLFLSGRRPKLKSIVLEQLMFADDSDHVDDRALLHAIFSAPACPKLDSIDLRGSTLFSPIAQQELGKGRLRPQLQSLFVDGDGISSEDLEVLLATRFPALRTLDISRGDHSSANLQLAADSRLKELSLIDMRLTDKSVESLLKSVPATIRDLSIQGGTLSGKSAERLAFLPQFRGLGFLSLADNKIDSRGAAAIARSPVLTKLAGLKLGWNTIDANGARAIAASDNLRSLRFLHLGDNRLGDEGASALAASDNLKNLIWLNVDENGLTDEAVRTLLDSRRLENVAILRADSNHLDIEGTLAHRFAERFGRYDFMAAYAFYGRLI